MNTLYPLKFEGIYKSKIWGGNKLKGILNKAIEDNEPIGESWEISGVQGNLSVVSNGFLAGNNIEELIEIYLGDLVGDRIYETFGNEFPLLLKFIDANDFLSIQVHPDDELARERHNSYGKTEMWYVVQADKDSELIAGFNQEMSKEKYLQHFGSGTLREILNFEKVKGGDVFFMPAGKVHATGPGILFAEIQQTSDITYRIYDWDRTDSNGEARELHTELAIDAINFSFADQHKKMYDVIENETSEVVNCEFFTTNIMEISKLVEKDYNWLDSFVVYMVIEGDVELVYSENNDKELVKKGETILLPAILKNVFINPTTGKAKLLEIYIK